ncbi:nucleosidase [Rhodococcus sp. NPDC127528]|uniref:nucleosidase n=1 Tax=unclassified Rhodococcus (in: high G+C Gram-positive bacteria) TaxID=192944 RepID=UPI003629CED8
MTTEQILVVSATAAEAAHVPSGFEVLVTGIGKVDAAVAVAEALGRYPESGRPRVVNIGTAGALHDHHSGLFVPSAVLNHDISAEVLGSLGYPVRDRISIDGGDGSVLATGDMFVTDPAVRADLAARADLVDMEGFAIAAACERMGAPCRIVKHVSDRADDSALDWPTVVDASARVLGAWLADHC